MNTYFLVLLWSACIGHAQGIDQTPSSSLADLLLVQHPTGGVRASSRSKTGVVGRARKDAAMNFDVKDMPGITKLPTGFFDPAGFTKDASEGRVRFWREVELKHGRLGMLAALGFLTEEKYIGSASLMKHIADPFALAPLILLFSISEVKSLPRYDYGGEIFSSRSDVEPGDYGFDPLKMKPTDPTELKTLQTKELNNGRLGMLAAAGMIAQELVTGEKIF